MVSLSDRRVWMVKWTTLLSTLVFIGGVVVGSLVLESSASLDVQVTTPSGSSVSLQEVAVSPSTSCSDLESSLSSNDDISWVASLVFEGHAFETLGSDVPAGASAFYVFQPRTARTFVLSTAFPASSTDTVAEVYEYIGTPQSVRGGCSRSRFLYYVDDCRCGSRCGSQMSSSPFCGDLPSFIYFPGDVGKTYILRVWRFSRSATFSFSVSVSLPPDPPIVTPVFPVSRGSVAAQVASVTLKPICSSMGCLLFLNNQPVSSGSLNSIQLGIEGTTMTAFVRATSGTSTTLLTIVIQRQIESLAALQSLQLSTPSGTAVSLNPPFSLSQGSYTAVVDESLPSVDVTPICLVSGCSIRLNSFPISSGDTRGAFLASFRQDTVISISVMSPNQDLTSSYQIIVQRPWSNSSVPLSTIAMWSGNESLPLFQYSSKIISSCSALEDMYQSGNPIFLGHTLEVNEASFISSSELPAGSFGFFLFQPTTSGLHILTTAIGGITSDTVANVLEYTGTTLSSSTFGCTRSRLLFTNDDCTCFRSCGSSLYTSISPYCGGRPANVYFPADNTKTYILRVFRWSSSATFSFYAGVTDLSRSISVVPTSKVFFTSIPEIVSSVSVYPSCAGNCTISIDSVSILSGNGREISLADDGEITTVNIQAKELVATEFTKYLISVFRRPGNSPLLRSISLFSSLGFTSPLEPAFSPETFSYRASFGRSVGSFSLTPTCLSFGCLILVNGQRTDSASSASFSFSSTVNSFSIQVTVFSPEQGLFRTYTITVERSTVNLASLQSIFVQTPMGQNITTMFPIFSSSVFVYRVSVPFNMSLVNVTGVCAFSGCIIQMSNALASSGQNFPFHLQAAGSSNVLSIQVTASTSPDRLFYVLIINRLSNPRTRLTSLTFQPLGDNEDISLQPPFSPIVSSYVVSVVSVVSIVRVRAVCASLPCMISGNGGMMISGSWMTLNLPLIGTSAEFSVTVTSSFGSEDASTYSIVLSRGSNTQLALSQLALSSTFSPDLSLSPAFSSETLSYQATIDDESESLFLSPICVPSSCYVLVNGESISSGSSWQTVFGNATMRSVSVQVKAPGTTLTTTYDLSIQRRTSPQPQTPTPSLGCFADGQYVVEAKRGVVQIESVRVGDAVLGISLVDRQPRFSKVTWIMGHRSPVQVLQFHLKTMSKVEVETYNILVTPNHLMILDTLREVEARDIRVGDTMLVCERMAPVNRQNASTLCGTRARVISITVETDPRPVRLVLTESGTIAVQGIVASTLETSGSQYVHRALSWSDRIAGLFGVSLVRKLTYALGALWTHDDAYAPLSSSLS